jgi:protein TonB
MRLVCALAIALACHAAGFVVPSFWNNEVPPQLIGDTQISVSLSAVAETSESAPAVKEQEALALPEKAASIPEPMLAEKGVPEQSQYQPRVKEESEFLASEPVLLKAQSTKKLRSTKSKYTEQPVATARMQQDIETADNSREIGTAVPSVNHDVPAVTHVTAQPLYQSNPKPVYPQLARRRNWQGTVLLDVLVSSHGNVNKVSINRSCGYEILDTSALRAVKRWKFIPATQNGITTSMKIVIPVSFVLK